MTEAYKFSNARQARASESNLRILFSTLPPFRFTTASVAAHARSPSLAQRAAARPCRPSELIEHSSADSTCSACQRASAVRGGHVAPLARRGNLNDRGRARPRHRQREDIYA
eukprot:scaffold8396_cov127-Isochrysis_galbana.AAC.4